MMHRKRCKKPKNLAPAKQPADAGLRKIRPLVAGIDVGSEQHFVCAPTSDGGTGMRVFGGTTPDLQALLEWLQKSHLESVAMESTGVYWIPLYELLASRGIEVLLTDTRQFSRVNSLTDEVRTIAQHYRDRGDVENNFDELKNQWGWAGFTTQDRKRCQIMGRVIALVYNWWTIFMRLGIPGKHAEAITSRPLALQGVARQIRHGNQTTVEIHQHARQGRADCGGADQGERVSQAHQSDCGAVKARREVEANSQRRISSIPGWQVIGSLAGSPMPPPHCCFWD